MAAVTPDTRLYERQHGERPGGSGWWGFWLNGSDRLHWGQGTLEEAFDAVMAEAEEQGIEVVYVEVAP